MIEAGSRVERVGYEGLALVVPNEVALLDIDGKPLIEPRIVALLEIDGLPEGVKTGGKLKEYMILPVE